MALSTLIAEPGSPWLNPRICPLLSEITCTVAPACSSAFFGSVNSTASTPSVAMIATFLLFKFDIYFSFVQKGEVLCSWPREASHVRPLLPCYQDSGEGGTEGWNQEQLEPRTSNG